MEELEILEALLEVLQMVGVESGIISDDVGVQTQTLLEVKETMLQIQEQNAKMYITVGLIQAVLFATCVITLVRGWLHGSRD